MKYFNGIILSLTLFKLKIAAIADSYCVCGFYSFFVKCVTFFLLCNVYFPFERLIIPAIVFNASDKKREFYIEQGKIIDDIQRGIISISKKEKPFDIFILYKETDNEGKRTQDTVDFADTVSAISINVPYDRLASVTHGIIYVLMVAGIQVVYVSLRKGVEVIENVKKIMG